jgi:hypothetical protein
MTRGAQDDDGLNKSPNVREGSKRETPKKRPAKKAGKKAAKKKKKS